MNFKATLCLVSFVSLWISPLAAADLQVLSAHFCTRALSASSIPSQSPLKAQSAAIAANSQSPASSASALAGASPVFTTSGVNLNRGPQELLQIPQSLDIITHAIPIFGQDENGVFDMFDDSNIYNDKIPVRLIGEVLCYPNPFRLSEGTRVGYRLSKPASIDVFIYDMLGHKIFENHFDAGTEGGKGGVGINGYNYMEVNLSTYSNFYLSAGVYILALVNDGKVIGKTKMAVKP